MNRLRWETGNRIAWLSLDEDDNDPARFLAHLPAALQRSGVDVEPGAPGARQGQSPAGRAIVSGLVDSLASLPIAGTVLIGLGGLDRETGELERAAQRLQEVVALTGPPPASRLSAA